MTDTTTRPRPPSSPGRPAGGIRLAVTVTGMCGLALALALILHSNYRDILRLLASAGWALLLLVPIHLVPIALDAAGWRALLEGESRATWPFLTWVAAVRDSMNALLPVARMGGEVVGVRLVMLREVTGAVAGASVIVEITVFLAVQLLSAALGLAILFYYLRESAAARVVAVGLLVSVPALLVFFLLQHRWGLFQLLERVLAALTGGAVLTAVGDPSRLDRAIQGLYRRRAAIGICVWWQVAALAASIVETWFTLYLLGQPPSLLAALLLETLAQAVQSAFFLVPGGLGTQEGGFMLFGAAVGLRPEIALALSLARRVRMVGFGVPALLSWQWVEGRQLRRVLARSAKPEG